MRFKELRIKYEFDSLTTNNIKLWNVLNMLDKFTGIEFGRDICITSIYRTPAENEALYKDTPVEKRPKATPHCFWHAADLRATDFDEYTRGRMLQFLNAFTYKDGQGKPVAFVHVIAGNNIHFHLQV